MTLVEIEDIQSGIGNNLNSAFQYLEKILDREDNFRIKLELVSNLLVLFQNVRQEANEKLKAKEQSFKSLRNQLKPIKSTLSDFLNRYPNYLEKESQEKVEKLKSFFELLDSILEGLQIVNSSEQYRDDIVFLTKIYEGLDIVVTVTESHGSSFPLYLKKSLKTFFTSLPVKVSERLKNLDNARIIDTRVEKYHKDINRASISGIWHLDYSNSEFKENYRDNSLEKQLHKNKYVASTLNKSRTKIIEIEGKAENKILTKSLKHTY